MLRSAGKSDDVTMKRQLFLVSSEEYNKFVMDIVVKASRSSRMVCYVTLNKTHRYLDNTLRRRRARLDRFRFIDVITPTIFKIVPKKNCIFVSADSNINKLAETIITTVLKNKADLVVIDSLSSLLVKRTNRQVISFVTYISSFLEAKGVSLLFFALIDDASKPAIKQVKMSVDETKYAGVIR